MTLEQWIDAINRAPVDFKIAMQVIDQYFDFTPTEFKNGETFNAAGQNNGSCKLFGCGKLLGLSEQAMLNAFGDFYTVDVLQNPQGTDHQNIRNFIQYGWQGIEFKTDPLSKK